MPHAPREVKGHNLSLANKKQELAVLPCNTTCRKSLFTMNFPPEPAKITFLIFSPQFFSFTVKKYFVQFLFFIISKGYHIFFMTLS